MPRDWQVINIKYLSQVKRGASPRPIDDPKFFDENGDYAWVRIADVTASDVYLLETTQKMSSLGSSLSVKLEPDQIFLSIAGTVGKPCITAIKACIHDGFVYFPYLTIPNKFLFYVFAGEQAYKGLGKMGTQLNLNTDTVGGIKVALPSNNDFIANIVNFLDHETAKIDNLIEKQQQLIELLKEKRQAVISHAVTKGLNPDVPMKDSGVEWLGEVPEHWKMKRLAYLGSARNGLTYSPENITDQESGVLVLRSSNIQNSNLCFDDNVYVNTNIPEQFLVKENDLLICSRNGSRNLIGKNALINKKAEGMAFGAFMAIFRSQINSYIFWVLNSPLFDYQSGSFLTSTINQLTISNLNSMEVPLPPLMEQKEIELHLFKKNNDFIELINKVNNSIILLQERRTALISAAVTGKIDVRDWVALDAQQTQLSQEITT